VLLADTGQALLLGTEALVVVASVAGLALRRLLLARAADVGLALRATALEAGEGRLHWTGPMAARGAPNHRTAPPQAPSARLEAAEAVMAAELGTGARWVLLAEENRPKDRLSRG